ncbi:hypothetical protein H1C71_006016 [Ictidomys tridecemlineatus]|nr:hypothetical protein H1C71_006016 [Ictidomys tridecemlineatus]
MPLVSVGMPGITSLAPTPRQQSQVLQLGMVTPFLSGCANFNSHQHHARTQLWHVPGMFPSPLTCVPDIAGQECVCHSPVPSWLQAASAESAGKPPRHLWLRSRPGPLHGCHLVSLCSPCMRSRPWHGGQEGGEVWDSAQLHCTAG